MKSSAKRLQWVVIGVLSSALVVLMVLLCISKNELRVALSNTNPAAATSTSSEEPSNGAESESTGGERDRGVDYTPETEHVFRGYTIDENLLAALEDKTLSNVEVSWTIAEHTDIWKEYMYYYLECIKEKGYASSDSMEEVTGEPDETIVESITHSQEAWEEYKDKCIEEMYTLLTATVVFGSGSIVGIKCEQYI